MRRAARWFVVLAAVGYVVVQSAVVTARAQTYETFNLADFPPPSQVISIPGPDGEALGWFLELAEQGDIGPLGGVLCFVSAENFREALLGCAWPEIPPVSVCGWTVRAIELSYCHSATLLTSPDGSRHYYFDLYTGIFTILKAEVANTTWVPLNEEAGHRLALVQRYCRTILVPDGGYIFDPDYRRDVDDLRFQIESDDNYDTGGDIACPGICPPARPEREAVRGSGTGGRPKICPAPRETDIQAIAPVGSIDPNDKVGPTGSGPERYVPDAEPLRYVIYFENLETATAPAQDVAITDQLDPALVDLTSLILGPVSFGDTLVQPEYAADSLSATVDLRPDTDLLVQIEAGADPATSILSWRMTALDPATGQPPDDPLAGFLPPNVNPPEGDGSVVFTIDPVGGLPSDTEIANSAAIVFDLNPPIQTPQWSNTIDNEAPQSAVLALAPVQTTLDFPVTWQGTDAASGIRDYTVFVSEDGGPFTVWLQGTSDEAAQFTGTNGSSYSFYSVARDNAGNVEPAAVGDTTTLVDAPDVDSDGIPDAVDNCLLAPNADQRDTNADGYGNVCDADLDGDCSVNFVDLGIMKSVFFGTDPDADLDGDGAVNFVDLGIMKGSFFMPPGPSGVPSDCDGS